MIRRPRQLIAIGLAVILSILILLLLPLLGARAAVSSILSGLPVVVEYDRLGLSLSPLGVELTGVRVSSLPGLPIDETTADEIRVALVPGGALTLTRGQRSLPRMLEALRTVELLGVATRVQLSSHTAAIRTEGLSITGLSGGGPLSIESPGFQARLSGVKAAPASYVERSDRRDTGAREIETIAERLKPMLQSAVTVSETVPPLSLNLGPSTIQVAGESAVLSGKVMIGDGSPLTGTVLVSALPLPLLDGTGGPSIPAGRLSGEVGLRLENEASASLKGTLTAEGVSLRHERVAEELIGPTSLSYEFEATINMEGPVPPAELARPVPGTSEPPPIGAGAPEDSQLTGGLKVTRGVLRIGSVELEARPVLWGLNAPAGDLPLPLPARLELEILLPETPLQEIVESIPASILGPLKGTELEGTAVWDLSLEAPLHRLSWSWWEQTSQVEGFRITTIDPRYDVRSLSETFRHRLGIGESRERPLVTIPSAAGASPGGENAPLLGSTAAGGTPDGSYRFVPYEEIAPAFIGAVITAEDGEFFRHNGVNWRALTYAAQRNLLEGEIVVGGSTIPMQLAKNVFLDGDRVIARKLQELGFVALANLSEAVSRERILEIYLNVIEFGPAVYGIAEAASHYFGTTPANLTVEQSVWLASIIRSPRFLSRHAEAGNVPPYWLERMEGIMELMVERGRLSPEEVEAARGAQPRFR